jgi:hypothetical protein
MEELDEEEVDVAAANARLASMDLSAPAPITERKRKPRSDAGKPRAATAKETAPYYITPASGVRLDVTQAAGRDLFFDWIEAAIIDQNKDAIVGAINMLLADVLKAKAKQ